MRLAILLTILAMSTTARADDYRDAISLQLASLAPTGVAAQAEHNLQTHKLSVVGAVGVRKAAAGGEYDSLAMGVGVELRYWRRHAMKGLYAGLRTDLTHTSLQDTTEMRDLGSLWTWSGGGSLGYRWVIHHTVEITPAVGFGRVVEGGLGGRSPTTTRATGTLGLTAGGIF